MALRSRFAIFLLPMMTYCSSTSSSLYDSGIETSQGLVEKGGVILTFFKIQLVHAFLDMKLDPKTKH